MLSVTSVFPLFHIPPSYSRDNSLMKIKYFDGREVIIGNFYLLSSMLGV